MSSWPSKIPTDLRTLLTETTQISNSSSNIPIHEVVKNLREALRPFGLIKSFRAFWDFSGQSISRLPNLRSELSSLSSSGVTLIDCPASGRKDLAVKIMLGTCFPQCYDGLPEQSIQVDLIAHGWDNSPPHTFVVITADPDMAYAISTLRMRGYRVVVISPSGTAENLSAQGSVFLELTRAFLGLKQDAGVDEFLDRSVPPAEPTSTFARQQPTARPAPSTTQYQKPRLATFVGTNPYEKPPAAGFELRDLHTARARRDSPFSYDRRKFDIFGGMEDLPATSDVGRGSFGLGDGPLFPRSLSRAEMESRSRADSAPPNMFSTGTLPAYGGLGENENGSPNRPASKGKQRELPLSEPEDIAPYPGEAFPHIPYSGSVFEPFGEKRPPFQTAFSFSPPRNKSGVMHSSSNSSASSTSRASTSRDSHFSLVAFPESTVEASTAPTSAEIFPFTPNQQSQQKAEIVIEVVNEPTRKSPPPPSGKQTEAAPQMSPPFSSSINETAQKATQTSTGPDVKTHAIIEEIPTPVLVPPVPTDKVAQPSTVAAKETPKPAISKTPPTMIASSSKQAAPVSGPSRRPSVPASFQLLVDLLRKHGAMKRTFMGEALVKADPKVYSSPNSKYKHLKTLISAASQAGIIELEQLVNKRGQEVWRLTEKYA